MRRMIRRCGDAARRKANVRCDMDSDALAMAEEPIDDAYRKVM